MSIAEPEPIASAPSYYLPAIDEPVRSQEERTAEAERLFTLMRKMSLPKTGMGMAREIGHLHGLLDSLLIGAAVNGAVDFDELARRVEAHAAKVPTLDGAA